MQNIPKSLHTVKIIVSLAKFARGAVIMGDDVNERSIDWAIKFLGYADANDVYNLRGAALFSDLWNAPVQRVAVENPVMHKHAKALIENYQEFSQSVQPWQFGDFERKRTCLWLRGLPPLKGRYQSERECALALGIDPDTRADNRVHSMGPGQDRSKERSRFFPSIAKAMAEQWGGFALQMQEIAA